MKVVCIGDSLTYGFGVPRPFTWVALAGEKLGCKFINRGINGDTTGGMLARFGSDVVDEKPQKVVIMGGANDFIAGVPVETVRANITAMVRRAEYHAIVPVLGVQIRADFESLLETWASQMEINYVSKSMETLRSWIISFSKAFGFGCIDFADAFEKRTPRPYSVNFQDGMHPTRACQEIMADILAGHPCFKPERKLL